MNITKKEVEELLPQTVKDTDALSPDAKNMFAVLLNSLQVSKGAENTGELIIPTDRLKSYVGWRFERMMKAIRELEKYGLVTRIPGKKRFLGESATATRFIFNWDVIDKPIVRKTYEDIFAKFRNMKTSGNTSGNCNSNSNYNGNFNINNNSNTNYNENSNTNENSNINDNSNDILEKEFKMEKSKVEEHIELVTKGKSYTEITSLTIPIYDWIVKNFPSNSHRLKNLANTRLDKIKREGLLAKPSTTPVINEYEAGLPF
jgi:hypothetical protein